MSTHHELLAMQQKMEQIAKRLEAERSARVDVVLRSALAPYEFRSDKARQVAERHLKSKVTFTDAGEIVADGLPLEFFVNHEMQSLPGLLLPKATGPSAPASAALSQNSGTTTPAFDTDTIQPGMSKSDAERALKAIRAAFPKQG